MSYQWDWNVVFTGGRLLLILRGVEITIAISLVSLVIGVVIGLLTALVRMSRVRVLSPLLYIYVDFFRTTPALVQLIWIFYVLPILLGVSLSAFVAGSIALSLNAGAFLSEVFRAGLVSISKGQQDAAHVLGLSRFATLRYVIVPQALRRVLPPMGNIFIGLIKDSSLLSVIAVAELTYQVQTSVSQTFRPLELYTALAIVYFLITYPLSLLTSALERRYKPV